MRIVSARADLLIDGSVRLIHYLICSLSIAPSPLSLLCLHTQGFTMDTACPVHHMGPGSPSQKDADNFSFTTPQQGGVRGTRSASGVRPPISMG